MAEKKSTIEELLIMLKDVKKIELQGVTFQGDVEIILDDNESNK